VANPSPTNIPPKPTENGELFPDRLADALEIEAFIETYAPYEVGEEETIEYFRGRHATLELVPVAQLAEGGRDANLRSPANERKYQKMDLRTLPPLLVEGGKVLDGNHRFRAGKKRGLTAMWCYVVQG
jgi:hypothetical protein